MVAVVYGFCIQIVLLALVYGGAAFVETRRAVYQPDAYFSIMAASSISDTALTLLIFTGLFLSGVYIAAAERADRRLRDVLALRVVFAAWVVWSGFQVVRGDLLSDGQVVFSVLMLALVIRSRESVFIPVWGVGMAGVIVFTAAHLAVPESTPITNITLHTALPIATLAPYTWLMRRISQITLGWVRQGVRVLAVMLGFSGLLISVGDSGIPGMIVIFLSYLNLMGHSYRALHDRNTNKTLAGHWLALGLVLLLFGGGLIGVLGAYPWLDITAFLPLQAHLMRLAMMAVMVGMVNQVVAELREENRRITGLLPFWCVATGMICAALAAGGAALVSYYAVNVFNIDATTAYSALRPLLQLQMAAQGVVMAGLVMYALGFAARRLPLR
ncbi:MAG: hypothetical protein OHK0046_11530 [Anaerolineae bacterium]